MKIKDHRQEQQDSAAYLVKKATLAGLLTIYGRKPVLEALEQDDIRPSKLHMADSNKPAEILDQIVHLAKVKGAQIGYHSKVQLSRISKNSKQDQGVALDIQCPGFKTLTQFVSDLPENFDLIAVDAVTNPQNLGMIIRSVCASPTTAILLPEQSCARLDALVIKASAGTLFKSNIIRCDSLTSAIKTLADNGAKVFALASGGLMRLNQLPQSGRNLYVLGNETNGVSQAVLELCDYRVGIPMANGVESLNVSVAAGLVAFHRLYH
jgi:23S rRNA (guanosine2251-2'-O)-methyltransferase